jgi:hypothetical protein
MGHGHGAWLGPMGAAKLFLEEDTTAAVPLSAHSVDGIGMATVRLLEASDAADETHAPGGHLRRPRPGGPFASTQRLTVVR